MATTDLLTARRGLPGNPSHRIATMPAPTPDDILRETCTGVLWGAGVTLHDWATEGGTITVPASELRPALEAAYDPSMPDWTALITHDSEEGFHVA